MPLDLSSMKAEILAKLEQESFATFYSDSSRDTSNIVYWDVKRHPEIGKFMGVAKSCGCTLMVFYERTFSQFSIDDTLERLEACEMSREEKRSYEARLKELQKFEGFICELELSFTHSGQVYLYQARTEWFEEFEDIFADVAVGETEMYEEEEEDEGPISGYFSRN
jgi:hypothetical protein